MVVILATDHIGPIEEAPATHCLDCCLKVALHFSYRLLWPIGLVAPTFFAYRSRGRVDAFAP
jgi:hypothetical protein